MLKHVVCDEDDGLGQALEDCKASIGLAHRTDTVGAGDRQKTNLLMLVTRGRAAVCSWSLELDMNRLAQQGKESATEINEPTQGWPIGRGLIFNEIRKLESRISRHEISDWRSLNPS